jgi:hypothetical protein
MVNRNATETAHAGVREKAGEKLKDIIESLKGPKATKTDIETLNDSATAGGESDGEFQDSIEQQVIQE